MAPPIKVNPTTPALQKLAELGKPTAEDRRLLAQSERAAKAAVMAAPAAPKKFPPGQKPAAVIQNEQQPDPMQDYFDKLYGKGWQNTIDPSTYEAIDKLVQIEDTAIEKGISVKEAEEIVTGKKHSRGIEDVFNSAITSKKAQSIFANPFISKALGIADAWSTYTMRSVIATLGEKGLPKLNSFGVPTGEYFKLAPEDAATFDQKIHDPTYGWGKQFPLNSKEYVDLSGIPGLGAANKWLDRITGGAGDIFASPETYFTGVGGIAKKFLGSGLEDFAVRGAVQTAEEGIVRTAAEEAAVAAGKKATLEVGETAGQRAMGLASLARKNALEELAAARVAKAAAEEGVATVGARVAAGGLPEELSVAKNSVAATEARIAAAENKLIRANRDGAILRPIANVGPQTRQALGKTVAEIREGAQATIDTGKIITSDGARIATPVELELANMALEAIPADLPGKLALSGAAILTKKEFKETANFLGYTSGIKFKLPFAPAETALLVPGSKYLTKAFGLGTSGIRGGVFGSRVGRAAVEFFTPVAGESMVNSRRLLTDWETALRTGKITDEVTGLVRKASPAELSDIVKVLNADEKYRGLSTLRIKNYVPVVTNVLEDVTSETIQRVSPLLFTMESRWSPALREIYNSLTETEKDFYKSYSNAMEHMSTDSRSFARTYGAKEEFIPRNKLSPVQSPNFITWGNKNKAALKQVAKDLDIPVSQLQGGFIESALKEGSIWFGKRLTKVDLEKGVLWLNEIARKSNYGINFDVLTAAPAEALIRLAEKHARYQAFVYALDQMVGGFGEGVGPVIRGTPELKAFEKPQFLSELNTVESTVANFVTPENVAKWSGVQAEEIFAKARALTEAFSTDVIRKEEVLKTIETLNDEIKFIAEAVESGDLPQAALDIVGEGAQAYAHSLMEEVLGAKQAFWNSDPAKWQAIVPMLKDGFEALNYKMPNLGIEVRSQVARMFKNLTDVAENPTLLNAWTDAYNKTLQFQKTWMTGTLKFHSRNTQQLIFSILLGDGKASNVIDFTREFRSWNVANKANKSFEEWASAAAAARYPGKTRRAVMLRLEYEQILRQTFGYGGGSRGEVSQLINDVAATGKVGLTGLGPAKNKLSEVLSNSPIIPALTLGQILPPGVSRKIGSTVEEFGRYAMMYDGLMQGLNPSEAQARVNRFLFDYGKSSKADKVFTLVYPWFKFQSRNTALQLSAVWTNPKMYSYYNTLLRDLNRENPKSPWLTPDWVLYGATPLGGNKYFKPDLGIPVTTSNLVTQMIYSILNPDPNVGGVLTPFAQQASPAVKAITEAFIYGRQIGSPYKIYKPENFGNEIVQEVTYAMRQTVPPIPAVGRQLRFIAIMLPGTPGDKANKLVANKFIAAVFGTREITEEEQTAAAQIALAWNATGLPIVWQSDASKLREIWKRYYEIDDKTKELERQQKDEYNKVIEQPSLIPPIVP